MSVELDRILKEENLFSILNLASSASSEEIRASYKKLVKEVHPDRFAVPAEKSKAEEAFKRLGVAFSTLKDPLMRKDYERIIERQNPPQPRTSSSSSASSSSSRPASGPSASAGPSAAPASGPASGVGPRPATTGRVSEQTLHEMAEKHYQSGRAFERKNQMDDAIKEYQEAIRIRNEVGKFHSQLGLALDKKGWSGYAQAEFKVALHFDPTDKLALKHYKPTAGSGQVKSSGFKFLNLFRGDKGLRLGDILIKLGHLNKDQLQVALKQQNDEKLLLGEILIRKKYIKPEHLAQALIQQAETLQKQSEKA